MQKEKIDLITVSREFGAGGSDFAAELGKQLGWEVLDQDLIRRIADRLHLQVTAVQKLDEHPPSWLARVSSALLIAPPEMPVGVDSKQLLHMDAVAEVAQSVIVEAAGHPPLIVVGHSGQNIFATRRNALHVRLVAPLDSRIERLMERYGWDRHTAMDRAHHIDADRNAYAQRYYHREWRDPLLYDVVLNSGRITIAEAVAMVEAMVR